MTETIACAVGQFIAHKRAHGRKYHSEARELALLVRFAAGHDISCLSGLTPALLEDFLASRPRPHPRSFNHLLGVVRCLLDWAVTWRCWSPPRCRPAATGSPPHASRSCSTPSRPAACWMPRPRCPTARGPRAGPGLPCHLRLVLRARAARGRGLRPAPGRCQRRPLAADRARRQVRQAPPGPARAADRRPWSASKPPAAPAPRGWTPRRRCSPSTGKDPSIPAPPARPSTTWWPPWNCRSRPGCPPPQPHDLRHSFAVACLLRWYREGIDPSARLCQLSTFMGHVDPVSTSVYLTMTPQLLAEPASKLEAFAAPAWTQVGAMTQPQPLGPVLHSFFASHLITVKGLRPASVRRLPRPVRLFLVFTAADKGCKITRLTLTDLTSTGSWHSSATSSTTGATAPATRNQRLAALHCLFDYIAGREPDMLATCQQVAAIPVKRAALPETRFLERDEMELRLRHLPRDGPLTLRDRALILFLYNTGARAQEVADLRAGHLDLGEHPLVRLHGKGDKWRTCPLWQQTAQLLTALLCPAGPPPAPGAPVFAAHGQPLTRYGIYKIYPPARIPLRRPAHGRRVGPHTFRRTAAVHLLEAGVEVNVIRGWLGPRRSDHDQPLRRDQHQDQAGSPASRRTTRCSGRMPD